MDNKTFSGWILYEIGKRGWNQAELAAAAGLSRTAISNVINGQRKPGADLCRKLAHALSIPEDEVFRQAGLLAVKRTLEDRFEDELLLIYKNLDPLARDELLDYARHKLNMKEKRQRYITNERAENNT